MLDVDLGAEPAAVGELHLGHVDMDASLLPVAVEAVIAAVVHVWNPLFQQRDGREALLPHESRFVIAISAPAIEESDLGVEVAPHLDDARDIAPRAGFVAHARAVRSGIAIGAGPRRSGAPPIDRPRVANPDAAVEAVYAVPVSGFGGGDALHGDHPDA